jgi:hypothetical protein
MLTEPEIINPFVESINQMIEHKSYMIALFLPVVKVIAKEWECINPVVVKEADRIK